MDLLDEAVEVVGIGGVLEGLGGLIDLVHEMLETDNLAVELVFDFDFLFGGLDVVEEPPVGEEVGFGGSFGGGEFSLEVLLVLAEHVEVVLIGGEFGLEVVDDGVFLSI